VKVSVRVWELLGHVARGVRLDVGEPVEFEVSPADTVVRPGREIGTRSAPTQVTVERLKPWMPSWDDEPRRPGAA